ncbi:hypothetical protein O6H91_04G057400 [Diphasiastrum complanatum]|uniref:Uncharacterized protein n=2 Tax=Diphasiastrum complanatum TaxID=34168 RepID=A0ACC2DWZ0_DIPCM|nr:hypothetical protein O6H91_Y293000 [Diphasiastrum complanatum]KAJ7290891.1 hypothetical protein O6H91_Y293000 [Diphasiastrum complanatum]KAJ7290892.1 hypothetical protein O6H91_Y293000 [Diphasiastrum complanatum]KAJ7290893.1 hypothetical protein O6H91_Y293000 [Diphasiastrum complanatum]KAJ7290894.1 hypothetical protein O6H91_Y293000 [Diphasiastrum complanatum]
MKDTKAKKGAVTGKGGKPRNEEKDLKKKKLLAVKDEKFKRRQLKKERKAKKDPNQPKRPPTAFFVFLEEFRKTYKESHPNAKGVAVVGKAGGDKWKELTDAEKAPYVRKAAQKKADYDKAMATYKQKQVDEGEEDGSLEESEKSKSEINDDEESEEEDDDDDE